MARSIKQIEAQIADVKRQITEKQKLQAIAQFGGSESLLVLLKERKEFHQKAINRLDPSSPRLGIVYSNNKVILDLMEEWIEGMTSAEVAITELKKKFLDLNGELQVAMDNETERQKRAM